MKQQEKELKDAIVDFLDEGFVNGKMEDMINIRVAKRLARAIIAKYPQILKNPVMITTGDSEEDEYGNVSKRIMVYANKQFDNNEQREQWIKNHYVKFEKHYFVDYGQKAVDQCGYCERDIRHEIHYHEVK